MPNDITYEITEEKNLIPASEGLTEEDLNTWKEENFGSGNITVNSNIDSNGSFSFYIGPGEGNYPYTNTYTITTQHGMVYFVYAFTTMAAAVENKTSSNITVNILPIANSAGYNPSVNVISIVPDGRESVTPTATCKGALIIW